MTSGGRKRGEGESKAARHASRRAAGPDRRRKKCAETPRNATASAGPLWAGDEGSAWQHRLQQDLQKSRSTRTSVTRRRDKEAGIPRARNDVEHFFWVLVNPDATDRVHHLFRELDQLNFIIFSEAGGRNKEPVALDIGFLRDNAA